MQCMYLRLTSSPNPLVILQNCQISANSGMEAFSWNERLLPTCTLFLSSRACIARQRPPWVIFPSTRWIISKKYSYKGVDKCVFMFSTQNLDLTRKTRSLLSKHVLNPFWTWFVTLWPLTIAPNTVRASQAYLFVCVALIEVM